MVKGSRWLLRRDASGEDAALKDALCSCRAAAAAHRDARAMSFAVRVRIELKVVTGHSADLQLCCIADVLPTPATEDRVPGLREFPLFCVALAAVFPCSYVTIFTNTGDALGRYKAVVCSMLSYGVYIACVLSRSAEPGL